MAFFERLLLKEVFFHRLELFFRTDVWVFIWSWGLVIFINDVKLFLSGDGLKHEVGFGLALLLKVGVGVDLMGQFEVPIIFHLSKD